MKHWGKRTGKSQETLMQRPIRPERVMALGFLALILLGGVLLSLPFAARSGRSIGLWNGLFTATSAVCVTGLLAVDTGTTFNLFGQIVLLLLIQTGGLGFMVFGTMLMSALGRKVTLSSRMLMRESMNVSTLSGLVGMTRSVLLTALMIEGVGALMLSLRFIPAYNLGTGLYYAVFHAVSGFCNAGFDLIGGYRSLTIFQRDPMVLLTISALILLGGLGFSVIREVRGCRGRFGELSLHVRIVLTMSGALLLLGTLGYALLEWNNPATLGGIDGIGHKGVNALMQSVTMRTAGFNSIDLMSMRDGSKFLSILLMFIGANPASTGGGVKTVTMAVMLLAVRAVVRGEEDVNAWKKRLSHDLVRRALAIIMIYLAVLLTGTLLLIVIEGDRYEAIDLLLETTSALATVGVSSVGTPNLTDASRVILALMMYFGRVGPLSMAVALTDKGGGRGKVRYPEENVTIG